MVPGHLAVHKGSYSIVLSYYDEEKKRHYKRIGTGLAANEKNKSKAEEMLQNELLYSTVYRRLQIRYAFC